MQNTGYMIINDKKILVLARTTKYYRAFKIRKSGKEGTHFIDEQKYLVENKSELNEFL